jgi:HTH-type transcriptional regulator / antitoxin HigA
LEEVTVTAQRRKLGGRRFDTREYRRLLMRSLPKVIETEEENEACIRLLEKLDEPNERLTAAEKKLAELLTLLIEDFEERHYKLKPAAPHEAVSELMRANGLKQKDLVEVLGTPSIVSEVLSGKRALSKAHIRRLSDRFHVSPEVFL